MGAHGYLFTQARWEPAEAYATPKSPTQAGQVCLGEVRTMAHAGFRDWVSALFRQPFKRHRGTT